MNLGVDPLQVCRRLCFGFDGVWVNSGSLRGRKILLQHDRLVDLSFEVVIDRLGKLGGSWWLRFCSDTKIDPVGSRQLEGKVVFESVGQFVAQRKV